MKDIGMKTYYDTNKDLNPQESSNKALAQQIKIIRFFREHGGLRSPEEIYKLVFSDVSGMPITSVRRAMTNLTRAGLLVKTDFMKEGNYGKNVHTWKLNEGQVRMF